MCGGGDSSGPARASDRGASAVEFALVMPLLVVFLFGMVQYGFGLFQLQSFTSSLSNTATLAATGLDSCPQLTDRLKDLVGTSAAGIDPTHVTTQLQWLNADQQPTARPDRLQFARVTATFEPFNLHLLPFPETVTRTTTVQVQNILSAPTNGCPLP